MLILFEDAVGVVHVQNQYEAQLFKKHMKSIFTKNELVMDVFG